MREPAHESLWRGGAQASVKLTWLATARYQIPSGVPRRSVAFFSAGSAPMKPRLAKFGIGQVVRHRKYPFRGVVYDVDPEFANTEEWWLSIPAEVRPRTRSHSSGLIL